jgi:glycosyltransferase involved in cell wall biosynthesis
MLDRITPMVLTYNEAENIERTLDRLRWAREVVVVDSFSTDATLDIARAFPNTRIVQRTFDRFDTQWNHAIASLGPEVEWLLALDADYVMTPVLIAELAVLEPSPDVSGYVACFRYCVDGVPLRGSLYPPSTVLFRRDRGRYVQDGHAYRLQIQSGSVERLNGYMLHDDRKPLARWLASQRRYAAEEAQKLAAESWTDLRWPDRARKVPFLAAPLVAGYCLFARQGILDGRAGWKYTGQRVLAECLISLELMRYTRKGPQP